EEQSVSAMMPKRTVLVSGESSAYAPPTQPAGSPAISPFSADLLEIFDLVEIFIMSESIPEHDVREVVILSLRSLVQKFTGEQVRKAGADLHLLRQRVHRLAVDLLPHVRAGCSVNRPDHR